MSMYEKRDMPFLEHLEALRWHLIRALVAIAVCAVGAFLAKHLLFHTLILGPTRPDFPTYLWLCKLGELIRVDAFCIEQMPFSLQSRKMIGQFTMHVGAALVAGVVLAFPYVFWEIWHFVRPALRVKERRLMYGTTFFVSLLFFTGVTFGYYVLVPVAVQFLSNYQVDESVLNQFDIVSYVSTILLLVLASGLVFQLPLLVYFLTKAELLSSAWLKHYRRHALVAVFVLAAMITPPDPFSQALLALPLMLLYFFSIFVAWIVERRQSRGDTSREHVLRKDKPKHPK